MTGKSDLRVCIHSPVAYPLNIGGPGIVATYLVKELDRLNIKIQFIFFVEKREYLNSLALHENIGLGNNVEIHPIYTPRLGRDYSKTLLFKVLAKYITLHADLLHFHTFPSLSDGTFFIPYLMKLRKIPVILSYHGLLTYEEGANTFFHKIRTSYFELTKDRFDRVTAPSKCMVDYMIREGFDPKRIVVIPHGIDMTRFNVKPKILSGAPSILFVGYTARIKGPDILLNAMKNVVSQLPNAKLHVVGYYDREFISLANALGIKDNIILYGAVPPSEVPAFYKGADLCLVPSRFESFSLVTLEAMAAGKPIIATNVGGIPELIDHRINGILVEPVAEEIAERIVELWENPELREKIAKNAYQKAKEFSWNKVAQKYISLYKELIDSSSEY